MVWGDGFRNILSSPLDGSEIRLKTTWDVQILINNGINYVPISTGERRISVPSTVYLLKFGVLDNFSPVGVRSDWMSPRSREELFSYRENTLNTKGCGGKGLLGGFNPVVK